MELATNTSQPYLRLRDTEDSPTYRRAHAPAHATIVGYKPLNVEKNEPGPQPPTAAQEL